MKAWPVSPTLSILFALAAWTIAAIALLGVILSDDLTGRLIFGIVWILIGIMWWGQYFLARKGRKPQGDRI
jgi:hypothetical protein